MATMNILFIIPNELDGQTSKKRSHVRTSTGTHSWGVGVVTVCAFEDVGGALRGWHVFAWTGSWESELGIKIGIGAHYIQSNP